MEQNQMKSQDSLLYWFFGILGIALVFLSIIVISNPGWSDLLLNVGATLISTSLLSFLYQRFGSQSLARQLHDIKQSLLIARSGLGLGVREFWRERRYVPAETWNEFTERAEEEVWLLGIAESGYAGDLEFHRIVSEGTLKGCNYRILLIDPLSRIAEQLDEEEGGGRQIQGRISRAIREFQQIIEKTEGKSGTVELRLYDQRPNVSIVRADGEMLITPYMAYLKGNESFTMRVVQGGIFEQCRMHFEKMWDVAKLLPETNPSRGQSELKSENGA